MITNRQITDLAKLYRIDGFTIMREYLQLVFLSHLYRQKESKVIYFKGGTAIRFLFGSPRFSEDLDFSSPFGKSRIKKVIEASELSLQAELAGIQIMPVYSGKEGERYRLKYRSADFKYPLTIRLDFHASKVAPGKSEISAIITKFPVIIFPLVSHMTEKEILKEKIQALIDRGKGRDFFDVWFLLKRGNSLPKQIDREAVLARIRMAEAKKLNRDLVQFLPSPQRKMVRTLNRDLQSLLENKTNNLSLTVDLRKPPVGN